MNDVMTEVEAAAQARDFPAQAKRTAGSTADRPSPAEVPWTFPSRAEIHAILHSADEQRIREIKQGLAALFSMAARALGASRQGNWRHVGAMVLVFATLALLAGVGFADEGLPAGGKRFALGAAKWMPMAPPAAVYEAQAF